MSDNIREIWLGRLEESLPPEESVIQRNRAITAQYAQWYLASPELLKWAGIAAFASHRVGFALLPYKLVVKDGKAISVADTFDHSVNANVLLRDLDLIRQTNNLVFADIGWAHLAYLSPDGGIEVIEEASQQDAVAQSLLEGFREIEMGRRLLNSPNADQTLADAHIWRGNFLLLRHEQFVTVQRQFDRLEESFAIFLSLVTTTDFDANNLTVDWSTHTSFYKYMWTRGLFQLAATRSWPDITNVQHRWHWISRRVLPIWKRVDATDRTLRRKMNSLIRQDI